MGTDTGMLAHWPLAGDCRDRSGKGHHGRNQGADLAADGSVFDGRGAHVLVPPSAGLDLGTGDFTLAVEIHTEAVLDDVPGDIVSRYDPGTRTGFQLSLLNSAGVTAAQANYRHLHFGIDAGSEGSWADCGRPGNNLRVYSLCVFQGDLYAGTFETGADEAGGVYRYDGQSGWEPCGRPDAANTVASLCVYDGSLYAGTSRYRAGGSALPDSENRNPGGAMYRYAGGGEWVRVGRLDGADSCAGMAVYRGELYAIPLYSQGVFRYQGGDRWAHCGTPGRRMMSLGSSTATCTERATRAGSRAAYSATPATATGFTPAARRASPKSTRSPPTTGACTPAPGPRARSSATTARTRGRASAASATSSR